MPDDLALRFGPADAPLVLVAPALFEEANRTRAFTVAILRDLAKRGIASLLPTLPGTGESLIATEHATLAGWRAAYAAAVSDRPTWGFAIRGGALVDGDATLIGRYHLTPTDGASIVRDLLRTRIGERIDIAPPGPPVMLAGNPIARTLLAGLQQAEPSRADRTARLANDPRPADRAFTGRPLWRASEPGTDATLARDVAADIADWIKTCGG